MSLKNKYPQLAIKVMLCDIIVCIGVSTPWKTLPSSLTKTPLNLWTVQAHFLGNTPLYIVFLCDPAPLPL